MSIEPDKLVVELIKSNIWPVVVLLAIILFYIPVNRKICSIWSRMAKKDAEEKRALQPANENVFYCLATLHGEPVEMPKSKADPLFKRNRDEWERWLKVNSGDEREKLTALLKHRIGRDDVSLPDASDGAYFNNVSFEHRLYIDSFRFPYRTVFDSSVFKDGISADGAKFYGSTSFDRAEFKNIASFDKTYFRTTAGFSKVTFTAVEFSDTTFSSVAIFRGTQFGEVANFSGSTFKHEVFFGLTRWHHQANFINTKFLLSTSFEEAIFAQCVPDFRGAQLHEATEFYGVKWPPDGGSFRLRRLDNLYAYERLKQEMERLKKHEDEQFFHRQELYVRRRLMMPGSLSWVLNFGYDKLSGYGQSVIRPLLGMAALAASSFVAFWWLPVTSKMPLPWGSAAQLSLLNLVAFLPMRREALDSLVASGFEFNWIFRAISAAEALGGSVLLFLLALALKTRFRMR